MHRTCCTSPLAHSIPVEKLTFTVCKVGRRSNIWHEKIDALQQCALWGKPHEITPLRIKLEAAVLADWLHSNGPIDGCTICRPSCSNCNVFLRFGCNWSHWRLCEKQQSVPWEISVSFWDLWNRRSSGQNLWSALEALRFEQCKCQLEPRHILTAPTIDRQFI